MTIKAYFSGKYAKSYHIIDLVRAAANIQTPIWNEAAYMQTQFNWVTTYYNLIPQIILTWNEYTS